MDDESAGNLRRCARICPKGNGCCYLASGPTKSCSALYNKVRYPADWQALEGRQEKLKATARVRVHRMMMHDLAHRIQQSIRSAILTALHAIRWPNARATSR
jgi:hypothetical protein